MHNRTGQPVVGDDFFNRIQEQKRIWRLLTTENILLLAPRRVGKTSFMYKLQDTCTDYKAIFFSVQDVDSELEFINKLYITLDKQGEAGKKILKHIQENPFFATIKRTKRIDIGFTRLGFELQDKNNNQWNDLGRILVEALYQSKTPWLLLIDELPIFILKLIKMDDTYQRARDFLYWLRAHRINFKEQQDQVRWLFAGSIGLDTVVGRIKLGDTINDLHIFTDFGAFSQNDAYALLQALAESEKINLSIENIHYICQKIGWLIPYYIQLLFHELIAWKEDHVIDIITKEHIDQVYENLLTASKKGYFDYWRQRLEDELEQPSAGQAIMLLNKIAQKETGESIEYLKLALGKMIRDPDERDQQLLYLMDILENDGYIIKEEASKVYQFRSPLLKRFWQKRLLG